jgi:parallel beta-helix repeat protein
MSHKQVLSALLLICCLAISGAAQITSCGTISASGRYVLQADLSCAADGIDIQANNVKLFLNGHTITGPGVSSGATGVYVGDPEYKNVTILGPGTITNFSQGVIFDGTVGGGLIGVNVTGDLFCLFIGNSITQVPSSGLLISQNTLASAGGAIVPALNNSSIVGNNFSNSSGGVTFAGSNNTFTGNLFNNSGSDGFYLSTGSGNTFRGNQFQSNYGNGIVLNATGNHLVGNVALGNHLFDINESSTGCVGDTYLDDVFASANQTCVK